MAGIYIETKLRPCYVTTYKRDPEKRGRVLVKDGEVKCLFHCWCADSDVIPPSPMVGGHNGGVVTNVLGLVEREDGIVRKVNPEDIRFCDNRHQEYSFNTPDSDEISKKIDAAYLETL